MIKHDNIIYIRNIHAIGGVETYTYELVKKYKDLDIAVVCKTIDPNQRKRLKKFCRVYKHTNEPIECKVCITNWDTSIIEYLNEDAKVYTGLHTDYSNSTEILGLPKDHPRVTYIGITEDSMKKFTEVTGIERTLLCRNPLELEKDGEVLLLMSATRLSEIKGGHRMLEIANELDRQGIDFLWFIFTTDEYPENPVWQNKNVIHISNRLDLGKYMNRVDWIVQPSICEGDSYTLREALYRGKPVVVCELGYFKEYGIEDGVNAIFLNEDCSNVEDVVKRMKKPLKFKFEPIEDGYSKILVKGKSHYKEDQEKKVKIKCTYFLGFNDLEQQRHVEPGEVIEVSEDRADELLSLGCFEVIEGSK